MNTRPRIPRRSPLARVGPVLSGWLCLAIVSPAGAQVPAAGEELDLFEPDARLLEIAREMPAFGGLAAGEDGRLTVLMAGEPPAPSGDAYQALQRDVRSRIAAVYGEPFLAAYPGEVRVADAEYRLLDLARWRVAMDRALALPGVLSTDLDEGRNRVSIGVEDAAARRRVLAEAERLGIPDGAVLVEVVVPDVNQQASVRSRRRPLHGGVQIEADTGVFSFKTCTLGFNAIHDGVRGFVTNSHCTRNQGGNQGTAFHQPDDPLFGSNHVGDEVFDPPYRAASFGPCPPGRRCRTSDSAFVRYRGDGLFGGALVARTTAESSRTIDPVDSSDFIAGVNRFPLQGFVLDKVGRTTGWTSGTVTQTCAHIAVGGTDLTALCSYRVSQDDLTDGPLSLPGDSGSPVFRRSAANRDVELHGILWGGPADGSGSSLVFSSILFVENELAPLQVVDFPVTQPNPPRPIDCPVDEKCCERDADNNCLFCIPRTAACP